MKNLSILAVCEHFGSRKKLAEIVGCSPTFVSAVIYGRRPMPFDWAPKIERASGGFFRAAELAPESPWNEIVQGEKCHTR